MVVAVPVFLPVFLPDCLSPCPFCLSVCLHVCQSASVCISVHLCLSLSLCLNVSTNKRSRSVFLQGRSLQLRQARVTANRIASGLGRVHNSNAGARLLPAQARRLCNERVLETTPDGSAHDATGRSGESAASSRAARYLMRRTGRSTAASWRSTAPAEERRASSQQGPLSMLATRLHHVSLRWARSPGLCCPCKPSAPVFRFDP